MVSMIALWVAWTPILIGVAIFFLWVSTDWRWLQLAGMFNSKYGDILELYGYRL